MEGYFSCTCCGAERSDVALGYYDGFGTEVCVDCATPEYLERVRRRKERDKADGHTGEDMCSCHRCALKFELG